MLEATEEIKRVVLEKADEATVFGIARKNGMITLKEDALIKAMRKQIPFEEVAQVGGLLDMESAETEPEPEPVLEETPASAVEDVARDLV
jgi:hypothetical protein